MTPFTCEGRIRLKLSQDIPPNASGLMNSVARTSPNRSTTVSQMIEEMIQCFAAPSGNGCRRAARSVRGAGASAVTPDSREGRRSSPCSAISARIVAPAIAPGTVVPP